MPAFTLRDVQEQTYKTRDSWWTVWLVDPLASRLVRATANRTRLTPNQLTLAALILGVAAAVCFFLADWYWLLAGAVLFHLSFVLDCMDGKIARLKGNGSVFGSWLDYVFDRVRVLICAIALMGGQFAESGNSVFLWFALGIVFTDMFRYLNSPQMAKVRTTMRKHMVQAIREAEEGDGEGGREVRELAARFETGGAVDDADDEGGVSVGGAERVAAPERPSGPVTRTAPADEEEEDQAEPTVLTPGRKARQIQSTALQEGFHRRFPWYRRVRDVLRENRIRPHLFSGIEFQMGVFIVAPLVGLFSTTGMLVTIAVSGFLMLAFELVIIYKLWLSTRAFTRVTRDINAVLASLDPQEQRPAA
ncbi:CDP-alcohol phosphatidyltransferase family protein [Nocardiopsis sp. EMB25]|uniref:CDP-alcohol phosphatidyltransferase family protein n=1 Tax=Nocardiopsis sp. EMB25 TaxID=2835867 RepID=UPI0022835F82|nr:CDP-alcohol phosphatidyltransferase family protein [Nocardiopsis sp. EMB25]MCY9787566.1 CDP-alcohol phosphatidyltransferase family protein [Nocardiopsis sp. EMB25]